MSDQFTVYHNENTQCDQKKAQALTPLTAHAPSGAKAVPVMGLTSVGLHATAPSEKKQL